MLIVSILSGGIAGFMVLVEWVLFEFFCAGLLESLAFFLAWTSAALTFIFYGAKACQGEDYEDINELFSNVFTEGDVDFSGSGCEYSDSSTYMTTAAVCYFLCAFLLCWYVVSCHCFLYSLSLPCLFIVYQTYPTLSNSTISLLTFSTPQPDPIWKQGGKQ